MLKGPGLSTGIATCSVFQHSGSWKRSEFTLPGPYSKFRLVCGRHGRVLSGVIFMGIVRVFLRRFVAE
jgi:hypothetical protein